MDLGEGQAGKGEGQRTAKDGAREGWNRCQKWPPLAAAGGQKVAAAGGQKLPPDFRVC